MRQVYGTKVTRLTPPFPPAAGGEGAFSIKPTTLPCYLIAGARKRCSLMASRIALSLSHCQHLGGDMDDVRAVIEQATDAAMGTPSEAPAEAPKPEMGTPPEAPAEEPKPEAKKVRQAAKTVARKVGPKKKVGKKAKKSAEKSAKKAPKKAKVKKKKAKKAKR